MCRLDIAKLEWMGCADGRVVAGKDGVIRAGENRSRGLAFRCPPLDSEVEASTNPRPLLSCRFPGARRYGSHRHRRHGLHWMDPRRRQHENLASRKTRWLETQGRLGLGDLCPKPRETRWGLDVNSGELRAARAAARSLEDQCLRQGRRTARRSPTCWPHLGARRPRALARCSGC